MRFLKISTLLIFFCVNNVNGDVGCYVNGSDIHTTPDGTFLYENATNAIPRYYVNPKIHRQTWSGDACGIPSSIVDSYPKAAGTTNNPDSKCVINTATYGTLINYNPSQSNCPVTQAPLDDWFPLFAAIMGIGSFYYIRNRALIF